MTMNSIPHYFREACKHFDPTDWRPKKLDEKSNQQVPINMSRYSIFQKLASFLSYNKGKIGLLLLIAGVSILTGGGAVVAAFIGVSVFAGAGMLGAALTGAGSCAALYGLIEGVARMRRPDSPDLEPDFSIRRPSRDSVTREVATQ